MSSRSSAWPSATPPQANAKPITVTQPHLPPLEEFLPYLEQIWASKILTNGGPFHRQLEAALAAFLGVPYVCLFANATVALVTALQALRIGGEVITTPYSFVATAHSLLWNGIKPVFVDIDPDTYNLDPDKIEAAITPHTTAIMPVHCYGRPCDTEAIQRIADNYNLKVIYDAAHAFGVQRQGQSVLNAGDLSILSFHATKVFNTFEGGAIVCRDLRTKQHIDHLKNFGFVNEVTVVAAGINGKMSEFNAALGLLQLQHMPAVLERRAQIDAIYRERLAAIDSIETPTWPEQDRVNWSYFPIRVKPHCALIRDALYETLKQQGISGRRYFYPLISEFPMYRGLPSAQTALLPHATQASREVICLPQYPGLSDADVHRVCDVLAMAAAPAKVLPLAA
jgi:dTDP-4-amino-4,6-dideoxygalactose transaminase